MKDHSELKSIGNVIDTFSTPVKFFRFSVFQGEKDCNGKVFKSKSVGMAYLREGDEKYSLRIFTFVDSKFYLLADHRDPSTYKILTATQNRSPNNTGETKRKFIWNVVGNGKTNSTQGLIELQFDLFDKPIYVSIFPERSAIGTKIPEPAFFEEAA